MPAAAYAPWRRHKYNVSPVDQRTARGRVYASKAEKEYADMLWLLRDSGDYDEVVEQPCVQLGEDFKYRPDFLVIGEAGIEYVDVKGVETNDFKRTKKLWKKYGRLTLAVVKRKGKRFVVSERLEGGRQHRLPR